LSQKGDNDAVAALLHRFKDKVKALSRQFFLIGADNEDLIQEGMIGLYKAILNYSAERSASFNTYANICIRGHICDAVKSANRKKHKFLNESVPLYSSDSDGGIIEAVGGGQNPEQLLLAGEKSKAFFNSLSSKLTEPELKTLELYLAGLSYENIAKSVGVTVKKVDNTLVKIRNTMSKMDL